MYIRKTAFFLGLLLLLPLIGLAQQDLYISGAVLEADSLKPLPGTTIKNSNTGQDLQTDAEGTFRILVHPGDTLQIIHMAYKPAFYYVPADLTASRYALIQLLDRQDVVQAKSPRAFPTQRHFEYSVMQLDPGNLTNKAADLELHLEQVTNDPTNMQPYLYDYMRNHQLYVLPEEGAVNYAPNNFLNPDRWRNFIKDWREGKFTEEAIEKLEVYPANIDDEEDGDGE